MLVDALLISGTTARLAGESEESLVVLRETRALADAAELHWQAAVASNYIGSVEHDLGRNDEAYRSHKDGLARSCWVGDPRIIAYAVTAASRTARAVGQLAEVEPLLAEARESCLKSGDLSTRELCAERLADAAEAAGQAVEALTRYAESVALLREVGQPWNLARVLVAYGYCALGAGDEEVAAGCFAEALEIACAGQIYLPALDALAGIATLQAGRQGGAKALSLIRCILQHPAASQDARSRALRLRPELESRLTPDQITAAQAMARQSPCKEIPAGVAHDHETGQ